MYSHLSTISTSSIYVSERNKKLRTYVHFITICPPIKHKVLPFICKQVKELFSRTPYLLTSDLAGCARRRTLWCLSECFEEIHKIVLENNDAYLLNELFFTLMRDDCFRREEFRNNRFDSLNPTVLNDYFLMLKEYQNIGPHVSVGGTRGMLMTFCGRCFTQSGTPII